MRGEAEAEVILVCFGVEPKAHCWAVAGALSLISPSSLQRTLPTALRSPSPSHNVPNNRAPRADLAPKCRQGLLRVSESSGLVQKASCAYSFTPCFSLHKSAHAAFCPFPTFHNPPVLWTPGTGGDVVSKPSLKKFPARLRLAGSRLHPTPKSQETTDSSHPWGTTSPAVPRAGSPASPAPPTGIALRVG